MRMVSLQIALRGEKNVTRRYVAVLAAALATRRIDALRPAV